MKLVDYLKKLYEGTELKTTANLGYVVAPNCIRRCLRVSQEEKMLLLEIYSLYNEEKGYAYPTQQTLAMNLGVTSSTVCKLLKRLEEKGFIESIGRKGSKKRYHPSFSLHLNPYIILSETTHFAVKVINEKIPDEIGGDWANKLLQFINVNKKEEFSELDKYGYLLQNYSENAPDELLKIITDYVSTVCNIELEIDWSLEKEAINKKQNYKESEPPFRQYSSSSLYYENKKTKSVRPEIDEEWLRRYLEND